MLKNYHSYCPFMSTNKSSTYLIFRYFGIDLARIRPLREGFPTNKSSTYLIFRYSGVVLAQTAPLSLLLPRVYSGCGTQLHVKSPSQPTFLGFTAPWQLFMLTGNMCWSRPRWMLLFTRYLIWSVWWIMKVKLL